MMICPKCGNENEHYMIYCACCGSKIDESKFKAKVTLRTIVSIGLTIIVIAIVLIIVIDNLRSSTEIKVDKAISTSVSNQSEIESYKETIMVETSYCKL